MFCQPIHYTFKYFDVLALCPNPNLNSNLKTLSQTLIVMYLPRLRDIYITLTLTHSTAPAIKKNKIK